MGYMGTATPTPRHSLRWLNSIHAEQSNWPAYSTEPRRRQVMNMDYKQEDLRMAKLRDSESFMEFLGRFETEARKLPERRVYFHD